MCIYSQLYCKHHLLRRTVLGISTTPVNSKTKTSGTCGRRSCPRCCRLQTTQLKIHIPTHNQAHDIQRIQQTNLPGTGITTHHMPQISRFTCVSSASNLKPAKQCHKARQKASTAPVICGMQDARGKLQNKHCVRKKGATFFAITLPNPNRSSKFFYRHTQQ